MTKLGIVAITINRDLFDTAAIRRILRNSIEATAKDIKIDFKVTTQTWNTKPKFTIDRSGSGDRLIRVIGTDNDIYKFVSGGTRVRYVTMTPGFQPKTRVRVIGSRAGKGGAAFFSRKKPKPGIKARKFDLVIAKKWRKLIPVIVQRAIESEIDTV